MFKVTGRLIPIVTEDPDEPMPHGGTPHQVVLTLSNPFDHAAPTTLHVRTTAITGVERLKGVGLPVELLDALLHTTDPSLSGVFAASGLEIDELEPGLEVGEAVVAAGDGAAFAADSQWLLHERRADDHDFGPMAASIELPAGGVAHVDVSVDVGGGVGEAALVHRITQVCDGVDVGGYALISLPD